MICNRFKPIQFNSHKNPLSNDSTHAPVNYFYNKQKAKLCFSCCCCSPINFTFFSPAFSHKRKSNDVKVKLIITFRLVFSHHHHHHHQFRFIFSSRRLIIILIRIWIKSNGKQIEMIQISILIVKFNRILPIRMKWGLSFFFRIIPVNTEQSVKQIDTMNLEQNYLKSVLYLHLSKID